MTENAAGNSAGSFAIPHVPQFVLLRYVYTFTQVSLNLFPYIRHNQMEFCVRDDHGGTRNLTVNTGVRLSNFWLPWDARQMLTSFDCNRPHPANAPQMNGAGNLFASGHSAQFLSRSAPVRL